MSTDDDGASVCRLEGNQYLKDKEYDLAIRSYTQAIEKDANAYLSYSNRAAAKLLSIKDSTNSKESLLRDALTDAKKSFDINPTYTKAYVNAYSALFRLKRFKEAEGVLEIGAEKCPTSDIIARKLDKVRKLRKQSSLYHLLLGSTDARRDTLFVPFHVFIVCNAIFYLLPILVSKDTGRASYFRALFACALVTLLNLLVSNGMVRFSKAYAARIIQDSGTTHLMLCGLMYASPTSVLALFAISSMSFVYSAVFVYNLLLGLGAANAAAKAAKRLDAIFAPIMTKKKSEMKTSWNEQSWNEKLYHFVLQLNVWNATAVVYLALFRVFELLTPARSFVATLMIWQYLRLVATLEQTKPDAFKPTRSAFASIDARLLSVLAHSRCPAFLGSAYERVRSVLRNMTALPSMPGGAAGQGPTATGGGFMSRLGRSCAVM